MKILAIDTTAKAASVALCEDDKLIALNTQITPVTHTVSILPMIDAMLKTTETNISDIDLFACSMGPGSFTGVRIGAAQIKGLAFGKNKPVCGTSTLKSMAYQFSGFADGTVICPVMDARRDQVYTAIFKIENGLPCRKCEDSAMSVDELKSLLEKYKEPIYFTGDGYALVKSRILLSNVCETNELLRHQNAYGVALCAYEDCKNGENIADAITLMPTYLRPPQAEQAKNK